MIYPAFPLAVPREPDECLLSEETMTLEVDGCVSTTEVKRTMCSGTCGSNATATFVAPFMEAECKCCKPAETSTQVVELLCRKYISIMITYIFKAL